MQFSSTSRFAATTLLSLAMICTSGCGRRMLKNHSSLAPRMSNVERVDSTIRSQDAAPENQVLGTTTWDGHSAAPKARLLTPQFGTTAETKTQTVSTHETILSPSNTVDTLSQQPTPKATQSDGGHSIGLTAGHLRTLMNKRRNAEAKQIDLLTEKDAEWQVLEANGADVENITPSPTEEPAAKLQVEAIANEMALPFGQSGVQNSSPTSLDQATTPSSPTAEERSVLDRLKGLYDDQEETARQLWKRNLQMIQSPWNKFRDREKPEETEKPFDSLESAEVPQPVIDIPVEARIDNSATVALLETVQRELDAWPRELNGRMKSPRLYQRRQQDLKLLHLIADQPGAAIKSIDGMAGPEQEFWQQLMLGLAHYRSSEESSDEQRITLSAGQLRAAVQSLSPLAALGLRRLEICSRINSFGRIETFPSNDFETGQPLLLYAELENFGTEPTARGTYRTSFDAQLQFLHIDSDEPIETIELNEITDEATSERTDYYQSFELNVPSHLAAGQYRIRVIVRDRIRRKSTEGFVTFQVRLTTERPSTEL